MPRGHSRIGAPHVTRARSAFNALDMFQQLFDFTTPAPVGGDVRISETGNNRISETGNNRIWQ